MPLKIGILAPKTTFHSENAPSPFAARVLPGHGWGSVISSSRYVWEPMTLPGPLDPPHNVSSICQNSFQKSRWV